MQKEEQVTKQAAEGALFRDRVIRIREEDNVAVAVRDLPRGTQVGEDITVCCDIPQAHKVALADIPAQGPVYRYGVLLGYVTEDVPRGGLINEKNLRMAPAPDLHSLTFGTKLRYDLPEPPVKTWEGYRDPAGGPAGTRNLLAIQTTVQCAAAVAEDAAARIRRELLPKYPNVDGVITVNHPYGCGVAIDAPDAVIPQRILKNLAVHPNFGGEFMLLSLGCEKFTPERFCADYPEMNSADHVIVLQQFPGHDAILDAVMNMAERKLARLNARRRETLPLSALCVGMQCGGSDAFSGITANPAAGYAADLIVSGGGTVLFSEVTEVRDGVQYIAERCADEETGRRLVREMEWYDEYLAKGGVDRGANTTPGNKAGGLSNIIEKSMGSIAKSGTSPIVEVLSPGERPTKHGEIFAATPASDLLCGPSQLASGIGLQVFMTGRGTPYGLAEAPVIKVCSRNEMKAWWPDIIDFNAGPAAVGEKTIAELGEELFRLIIDTASGRYRPYSERYGWANALCVFNPAPCT